MTSPLADPPRHVRRVRRARRAARPSIERTLPLLISALLAAVLGAALLLTYATLSRAARQTAADRIRHAAEQLAGLAAASTVRLKQTIVISARDSALRRAVAPAAGAADLAAARTALEKLLTPNDTGVAVELWDAAGRTVARAGRDARGRPGSGGSGDRGGPTLDLGSHGVAGSPDSTRMGAFYVVDEHPHFWVVTPVVAGARRVGTLAREYRVAEGPRADEAIRSLIGEGVGAYYRSSDGAVWTSISGDVRAAPALRDSSLGVAVVARPDVGRLLSASAPVAGAPLEIVIEMPERAVTGAARATVLKLAAVSLVLALLGVAGARAISRRITRPLASLTAAAESVARGDYATRVPPRGDEELVRLAQSFNRMAEEVSASRAQLELRAADAQAAAADLDRARADAEAGSRAKSDFLAVMSHELRTPLNAIAGYTELLEMELRGPLTDAQRRDLARIRASQQHLLGLISAVLDLSRIEAGRVTYELTPIALEPFVAGLDALVAPQAAAKSLTLDHRAADPTLGTLADREKLRQIMLNLLSNAIRYTPPGGRIVVAAEARGDRAAITVRDTGVGIPADKLEAIFEPFVQLDRSLTSVREGIGLGLAISRDLARGMRGDLTAESTLGEGSTFTLTLPRCAVGPEVVRHAFTGEVGAVNLEGGTLEAGS